MWALGWLIMGETLTEDRVAEARKAAGPRVTQMRQATGNNSQKYAIYIRAFKLEKQLEVWGAEATTGPFKKIATYTIAAQSGVLGPKRREGDRQVPEGLYVIDRFNPASRFHLSIGVNYPNASDKILSDQTKPGGDIFIHGDAKSIGCLAMTDEKIKEIYLLALDARNGGQKSIRVDIFPFRMTPANLKLHNQTLPQHAETWRQLAVAYQQFEAKKRVPRFKVDTKGNYLVAPD